MNIGEAIKRARRMNGLTQQEVADRMGIERSAYCQYERGCRNPKIATVERIAKAIGVEIKDICEEKNSEELMVIATLQEENKRLRKAISEIFNALYGSGFIKTFETEERRGNDDLR